MSSSSGGKDPSTTQYLSFIVQYQVRKSGQMHTSSSLFIQLTFHAFAPFFVQGAKVPLLRDVEAGHAFEIVIDNHNVIGSDGVDYQLYEQKSGSKLDELVKKILPSKPSAPYVSIFFQQANAFKNGEDLQKSTKNLARDVTRLISNHYQSGPTFQVHLSKNQAALSKCFKSAKTTLEDERVKGPERLWSIGIVAGLVKHLSSGASKVITQLKTNLWRDYIFLEIQVALSE